MKENTESITSTATISGKDIENAIRNLTRVKHDSGPLIWIDNQWFYKGKRAEMIGWGCTDEELELARMHPDGLIKSANGVNLYLSKFVDSISS